MYTMLGNVALFYVFWILIFHCCDSSTIAVSSPVQAVVGWNANFNMHLDPYLDRDAVIVITKNGALIMYVRGTVTRNITERFEFTGNTAENGISFILRNVTLGDAGTYIATETGIPRGEQKLIVEASPFKPQIIALTSSVLGSDYHLNCSSVSNSAPPDHGLTMMSEWKVNDQLITNGVHYKVQGTELTITSLTRNDNGAKLTCVACEDSLAKSVPSNEHVIDVKYGPDNVQLNPSGGIIKGIENHSVIIGCTADCNPICSFQWRRGSLPGYLKSNQTLMIDNVGKSDADSYTCTVSNGITGRSQSLQTTLVVIYGPSSGQVMLSTTQSNQTVEDSTMLNITCSADCYPPCSFTWTGPQGFYQPGTQLSRFVDKNKGGNYICTASNQENSGKSAMANVIVIVMYGPGSSINLGSNPPTIIVNLHQRAPDITCSATCNPPCDYRWYHNRTLYSNGAILYLGVVENKTSGGNYTCEAYNKVLGLDRFSSTSININVYCTPGKPLNFHSTNIREKQVSLRWQSGYDGGFTQTFVVEISLDNIAWNNVSQVDSGNRDGWFTTVIEDLIPGSEYYLRLYAYNVNGRGDFADVQLVIRMLKESSCPSSLEVGASAGIGVGGIVLGLIGATIAFTIRRQLNGPTNSCCRSRGKTNEEMHPYSNTEMNQQTVKPIYEELNKGNTEQSVYDKISPLEG